VKAITPVAVGVTVASLLSFSAGGVRSPAVDMRGRSQTLHLYGSSAGYPVIVSSGDGGWVHLAPYVADYLAANGYYVVGFDVKTYLSSFTSGVSTLNVADEPRDYSLLADFALRETGKPPILLGVSEGAGLSVLAATDPETKMKIAGVVGLGLPDINELGWRWKDAVIYLTHRPPDEPSFSSASVIGRVAPTPLALIHSTGDEFVPLAELQHVMSCAHDPKKLWVVTASNHRFSGNLPDFNARLLEAINWVLQQRASGKRL
jgi:virulence protein VirJ